ncbi:MAG TPA: hypothetical protein VFO67_16950 [Gemmatimonadales bacterium]|nr:hypothetical protein [Gemmatimonadales bacterium]
MTSATTTTERSEFRHILFSGTIVGGITGAAVIVYLLVARLLPAGILTGLLETIVVLAAAVLITFLPGFFANSRTVQGVASAAAIGLWGTIVFMAIDIILLRPFKAFPWTWDAVGGGSTWWYLPIWWMLGTLLAWLGGVVTAGRAARGGNTAITSLGIAPVGGGVGGALGLGMGGVTALPVGAGVGFVVTLVIFALIVLARKR